MDLWLIFITGLTTGGLSCLAVQGGLLATAMTRSVTVAQEGPQKHRRNKKQAEVTGVVLPRDPWPVLYFLAAKLVAYTILGALLGALGAAVQLTPGIQAGMQIVAGVFMLGTALNLLNVHPIFRYFAIQPPRFLSRMVRNQAKSDTVFAPALLGFLTVLIPCGTTQAMEIFAISSGSPMWGALIMAVFVLGTSPTFFVLGFLATQLRGKFQQVFALVTTLAILILGVVSINAGLNIIGSPLAPSRLLAALFEPANLAGGGGPEPAQVVDGVQEITINATDGGYSPNRFTAQSGQPIRLWLVTNGTYGCSRAFTIPSLGVQEILSETGRVAINVPPQRSGPLYFSCSMGMYTGVINVN
jgi:sulfite exporter TauE/SafE